MWHGAVLPIGECRVGPHKTNQQQESSRRSRMSKDQSSWGLLILFDRLKIYVNISIMGSGKTRVGGT